jgi:dTDP-4-amino-4,6-dideoxygalactose transaminase
MIQFLDLKKQYLSIKDEIDEAVSAVIGDTAFVGGKYVTSFEKNFATYLGIKNVVGVGNGTDALEIALWALDLPQGSEVIVPANTFIATSEAVSRNGLKICFVDCDEYYQMDIKSLQRSINHNTSAIIAVHLYGHPADMEVISKVAKENNLKLIEDAAQAHGAMIGTKKVATFGDLATFSFYPGKNLGAYGDGGAVVTNDDTFADKIRAFINHGRSSKFEHIFEGRNSRLDGMQAAVLDVKLLYLDSWLTRRNLIAQRYRNEIDNSKIKLPKVAPDVYHAWHLFVIQVQERDAFMQYMKENDIQTGVHYPIALPKLAAYDLACDFKACKEDAYLVSLPIGEHLKDVEIDSIIEVLNRY